MAKTKKAVDAKHEAYKSKGAKAPRPASMKHSETGPTYELKPTKGAKSAQGSKKVEQASKETASMAPGRKMGKSGKGKDARAAAAEKASKLAVKGPNEGSELPKHSCDTDRY